MKSLWSQEVELPRKESLNQDLRVANVVIGAGMAGILTAYMLQESGQEVIILEESEIASGQTKNTTAKITSQHGLIYHEMIKNCGLERARGYAKANEEAIREYKEIITKEGIACHFEELPSFLYSKREEGIETLKKEAQAAKELGIEAEYVRGDLVKELPFGVVGAVRFENQAQFHPLEFLNHLAKKLTIYEHTKVLEVDDYMVITDKGVVVANNIVFTTHYPIVNIPGWYFLRQHQSRSYVIAIKGEGVPKVLEGMYYSIDKDGFSFRCAQEMLLFGGSSHRTGKRLKLERSTNANKYPGAFCHLREKAKQYYISFDEIACWSAQDCMPHDRIPFLGRYSKKNEHWYIATGFQKWGMTTAMVGAKIICDMIMERENPYEAVFTPQRLLIKAGFKNLLVDIGESVLGLGKGLFVKKGKRCSHLGCALEWDDDEKMWNCPCHGSRYTKEGKRLDNPAQQDLDNKIS